MIVSQIKSIKTAIALLDRCGPLTLIQLSKLAQHPNPSRLTSYLVKNGYAGLLPTYPVKVVTTGKPFEMPEMTRTMVEILDTLKEMGPCSSVDIGKKIGKTRETVDSFLRQGREMDVCHVSGDRQSEFATNMRVYVWTWGPGENFVREKRTAGRPAKAKVLTTTVMTSSRRDPLTAAFFGASA